MNQITFSNSCLYWSNKRFSIKPNLFNVYFIFQGEPSWKAFLQQELKDYLGKRVCFLPIELTDLSTISLKNRYLDFQFPSRFSRYPYCIHFFYSNENELNRLTELTFKTFIVTASDCIL